jgi:hypothetical protein
MNDGWKHCYTCRDYAETQRTRIAQPLADKARAEERDVVEVVDEFMWAAHERHLDGESLRKDGPTRVTDPVAGQLAALMGIIMERDKDEHSSR